MTTLTLRRCDQCRSFSPVDSAGMSKTDQQRNPGRCRRFPPTVIATHGRWEWPLVFAAQWCHEFHKAPAEAKGKSK